MNADKKLRIEQLRNEEKLRNETFSMKFSEFIKQPISSLTSGVSQNYQLAFQERFNQNLVYEGLIKTYSISTTISSLKAKWSEFKFNKDLPENGIEPNDFTIVISLPFDDFENLLKLINTLGWFISVVYYKKQKTESLSSSNEVDLNSIKNNVKKLKEASQVLLKIEAKYDLELDRKFWPEELYHVTSDFNISKIRKIGLVPKSKNKISTHPERIYFGVNKGFLISGLAPQLKLSGMSKLLIISTDKLPENVRFFRDPNYANGMYTLANIPAYAILSIEKLK
jgi:hypothetical protein